MYILGAGMSGCIAAILNGQATIVEAAESPPVNHKAVLRFRTDQISKVTGIPFHKVIVYKSIFSNGQHRTPTPTLANMYSKKVTGKYLNRSIWNLDTSERFVAPGDFHQQLINMVGNRIEYGCQVTEIDSTYIHYNKGGGGGGFNRQGKPIISTMPMPVLDKATGGGHFSIDGIFKALPITTANCRIEGCNINHTIYFPDLDTPLYRATITGGNLIMEFAIGKLDPMDLVSAVSHHIPSAFGIEQRDIGQTKIATQRYGKIAPVDDGLRKAFMFEMTRELKVYSLGRFAVWKNILLDDVYNDVFAIRRMIEQSHYDIQKGM